MDVGRVFSAGLLDGHADMQQCITNVSAMGEGKRILAALVLPRGFRKQCQELLRLRGEPSWIAWVVPQ